MGPFIQAYRGQDTSCLINGNLHLAKMEVVSYDDLHTVVEYIRTGTVRVTIYRGTDPTPISKETYGSCNLD